MTPLAARLETWIWILIYGGLIVISIGFALHQQGRSWGAAVLVAGALATVVGIVLIWVRSRLGETPDP